MDHTIKDYFSVPQEFHKPIMLNSYLHLCIYRGFPGCSAGKESTCNAGDSGSIPGWGRFPGEGIGYPFQYSWASLLAQVVKNPPAMQETWVQSLGWEDPLKNDMVIHSSILAWRIPVDRGAWRAAVHGVSKSLTTERLSTAQHNIKSSLLISKIPLSVTVLEFLLLLLLCVRG